jgi:hypothetical protein
VLGNSITLRNWQPQPVDATVVATNRTWIWCTPTVICATQPVDTVLPVEYSTRWTSSGVWAIDWCSQQGYDQIWLLGMEGVLLDLMERRTVIPDHVRCRGLSQHWRDDWRELMRINPAVLQQIRPVITRNQHEAFESWSGWHMDLVADTEPQIVMPAKVTADPVE